MCTNNSTPSYTTQYSVSSMDSNSNDSEGCSLDNTIEYGPIKIRQIRKPAPTIATGRRPKSLVLTGDEAIKREQRREKNREAARKLKERRKLIEKELDQQLKDLEGEHSSLQNYLQQLRDRKQTLQTAVNNCFRDPIDDLLSSNSPEMLLFFEQYLDDPDLFDESIESILNF
ncbi:unnamed protein product [Adineta steineri]|uniref:BZIP domain-containing protein n=1 Tax=Adineta steineri TaxID=433720 RepID=A0A819LW84_9BILA|nr:unnamed protein product [Adineta steineri]